MKCVFTGPRSGLTAKHGLPHMHVEVELEELPRPGTVVILNSGGSYVVQGEPMWWIDGPENDAYWDRDQDYDVKGTVQTVHINVLPPGFPSMDSRYGEGREAGRAAAVAELSGRIAELRAGMRAEPEIVLAVVESWLKANETS